MPAASSACGWIARWISAPFRPSTTGATSSAIAASTVTRISRTPASQSALTAWAIRGRPPIGSVYGQPRPAMLHSSSSARANARTSPRKFPTTPKTGLPRSSGSRPQIGQLELRFLAELAQGPGAVDRVAAGRFGPPALRQPDREQVAVGLAVERFELGELLQVLGRGVQVVPAQHDLRERPQR